MVPVRDYEKKKRESFRDYEDIRTFKHEPFFFPLGAGYLRYLHSNHRKTKANAHNIKHTVYVPCTV